MKYIVREAVAEDYAEINCLLRDIHNINYEDRSDVYVDEDNPNGKTHFNTLINNPNTKIFVAEDKNIHKLLAYSIIKIVNWRNGEGHSNKKVALIDSFGIKSKSEVNYLGNLIFQHIVDYIKEEKIKSLQITIWEYNKEAIEFYKRFSLTAGSEMELSFEL